MLGVVSN